MTLKNFSFTQLDKKAGILLAKTQQAKTDKAYGAGKCSSAAMCSGSGGKCGRASMCSGG